MWGSLKSDLQELVSVVTEDTNVVLEKMQDEKKVKQATAAVREAERRMTMEETYLVPLVPTEEDAEIDEEEKTKIEQFQKAFDLESKTDEISELLEAYPDSVKLQFEDLVPQEVRYEDFWERFFYRCDEARIQSEWDEEDARAQKARAELVGSVSSFLGGAAKAVASGVATVTTAATAETGRPPFVLNTAVSEDEEEDEEEFGWGDEDEEEASDVEEEAPKDQHDRAENAEDTEQIEFKDEALENTQAELKQALEERDQLKETIELQKSEITTLRTGTLESSEVPSLREALAQKDNEIASLRQTAAAAVSSPAESNESPLLEKIETMSRDISAKDAKISELEELHSSQGKDSLSQIDTLKSENKAIQEQLVKAAAEATLLEDKLAAEIKSSKDRIASLTAELKAAKAQFKADQELMRSELEQLRACNEKESDATPESGESGVKLTKPTVSKLSVNDDEEDEWGDDWD